MRRSRLYYLRDLSGKKARLQSKVRDLSELLSPEAVDQRDLAPEEVPEAEAETVPAEEVSAPVEGEGGLRGKARKRAKALEKVERMKKLGASEKKQTAIKEAQEARRAAEAAAAATKEAPPEKAPAEEK